MTAVELVHDLQRQSFTLVPLPGEKLAVKPAERLTDPLREQIRQRKAEVLSLLIRPYINALGELVIPFTTDPRYHWWKPGGQSIAQTLGELNAPAEVWRRYVGMCTETMQ